MSESRIPLVANDLGDGHSLRTGRLPDELTWDQPKFEEAWAIHPEEKHLILMHGRQVQTPRWQQAYGADYHYTGRVNKALPVPALFVPLLEWVKSEVDPALNGVLLNWYEGPGHYIGPHHDSTVHMIKGSPIVTVSFGETRTFRLSKGARPARRAIDFPAPDGTVFVMPYDTNLAWKHSVPKSAKYVGRRISVTFRAFEKES